MNLQGAKHLYLLMFVNQNTAVHCLSVLVHSALNNVN